ncbi:phosphatidylinositol phosphatase PTPRQ-like [Xenopus laevis]|uniref:Phosphatidylinositol phosphatase PTPRQ-like n=1 Tax=Xenopus laevis TaxID=8355 RepID=A0A8J1MKE5_XENLA|nr:phosphatidylinositol phosphatase PTPRQ-like [Xenopus laevis]
MALFVILVPGPPVSLAGERVGSAGILLSWNVPRNPNGKILAYYVIFREVCPWMQSIYTQAATKPDSLEVLLTSLTPGTTYEIKVAAENSAGIGSYSESFLFQTAESAPGKVVNLTVEALNSSAVNLTWFLPRQPHGKITSFKISVKHARSGIIVKDTTVKVEDILNGALPECNDNRESFLWSTTSPSSTRGQSTTTSPFVSRTATSPSFNSIWNEPITFIVAQLRPYTTYLFEVSAVTSEPGYIDSTIVRTPESVPEDPPQNLVKGNITTRSFSVIWDAPTIVTGKFSYRVELYGPAGHILDNSTKDLRFTFTNLTPFTTYNAYISGETSAGVGPRANISVFTPAEVPGTVYDLNATAIDAYSITVCWRKPQQPNGNITQYRVKTSVDDSGVVIENVILKENDQFSDNLTTPTSSYISQTPVDGLAREAGTYEGSAEFSPTTQSMSSVIFHTNTNDNSVIKTIIYLIDIRAEQLFHTIGNLTPYTEYLISVSAFTTVGEGPPAEKVVRTGEQVPSAVQNVMYESVNSTTVKLSWHPPLHQNGIITNYTIYVMVVNSTKALAKTTTDTEILITDLKKFTEYKMRITASTSAGESNSSEQIDIFVKTLEDVPGSPPHNLSLLGVNSTAITLAWSPPLEPNGIITHYEVIYTHSTDLFTQSTISTSLSLTDLYPYTLYNISVRAYTRFGHGNQTTDVLYVTTSETAPSSPPYNLSYMSISSTEVLIEWQPPLFANGIIQFYNITYWNTSHFLTNMSNDSQVVLSDLKKFSQYQVAVLAYTVNGNGNQTSDILNMTTLEDVPDSAPENIKYTNISSTEIEVSFSPSLIPNGNIMYYTIYIIWENETMERAMYTTNIKERVTGLKKYTSYFLSVSASTIKGEGLRSVPQVITTDEDAPSSPPRSLTFKQLSGMTMELSWEPPLEPNGIILNYTVYIWNDISNNTITVEKTFAELENLETNNEYNAYVTTSTRFGDGNIKSVTIQFRTSEGAPSDPPSNVSYKNITSDSIMVFWTPPSKPNGIIQYYLVYYRNMTDTYFKNFTSEEIIYSSDNEQQWAIVGGLAKFSTYKFWITASTVFGDGNQTSEKIDVNTDEDVPESGPVINGCINQTSASCFLTWDPPLKPNGIITNYSLELYGLQGNHTLSTSDTFIPLEDLTPYTQFIVSIAATTIKGTGPSNQFAFQTNEAEPSMPPQNLTFINASDSTAWLHWSPSPKPNGIVLVYSFKIVENGSELEFYQNLTGKQTEGQLTALEPFKTYFASVSAFTKFGNGNQFSNNISFTTMESVPGIVQNIICIATSYQSVLIRWDPPLQQNGMISHYNITSNDNTVMVTSEDQVYTFRELLSNTTYSFKIYAVNAAGKGQEQECNVTTKSEEAADGPPQNITITATSQSLNISWEEPLIINGPTSFMINVSSVKSEEYSKVFIKLSNESKTLEVTGLKPFTNYSVIVTAFTGTSYLAYTEGISSSVVIVTTLEAVPTDPPTNIEIQKIPNDVTKVQMTFIPPSEPNGKIQYQAVVYKEDDPKQSQIRNLSIIKNKNNSITAVIDGLKGGYNYSIRIYAVNGAGAGPNATQMRITTDIREPPRPAEQPKPVLNPSGSLIVTATTFTIKMPICYFSDDNGPIEYIQVVVSEVEAQHDMNISRWHEAYHKKPKPYFTSDGFPNPSCPNIRTSDEYIIGANDSCLTMDVKDRFCNGPLKPRKQYLFKFRATNIKGQYTDSPYSMMVQTLDDGLSQTQVEIILSVTLCVLSVILLVGAIYAFARIRQKQKEGGTYSPRDAEIIDTKFKLEQLITVADLELKDERLTRPVSKKGFLQHVEELCTNNNLKFQEEFSELPKFLEDLAVSDADLPWNRSKNRFTNIKPYNNNRVKLIMDAGVPGSDYINASYVSGYICPNEFIATQGPLAGTVGDFWRMVWETRAKTIVMLTQCYEKGRMRCHQYWPEDNKPVTVFGDIVITKVTEDVQNDWTTRELKVERHGDFMMVRQCNFTSWPEHGVPESTASLMHFVKMIRANRPHENTPTIAHCSAGVGRTGLFVALDHLVQHINHHDFVDIYGLVAELRSERMCMVQNLAQYIFLHQCVVDLLASKGSSQPISFLNYSALQKMDSLDAMEGDVELEWEETTM